MEDYVTKTVGLGVISWTASFLIARRVFSNYSFDFSSRIVSVLHASLAVTLASLSVQDWECPLCPYASTSSPPQRHALAVTLSYMIYDVLCCLFAERVHLDDIIHHLVSIVGIGAGLYYQKCGSEQVAALWVTELSTPFLHLRELLKELGYKDTLLNLAADILFAVIFSLARMVVGPYITYTTVTADNPLLIKAMASGLQLVSAFWFFKILRMVKYKLRKWSTSKYSTSHTYKLE